MCEYSQFKPHLIVPDGFRHPVHNDYLPPTFREEKFLKAPDDVSNKVWGEDALVKWETQCNAGRPWSSRQDDSSFGQRSRLIGVGQVEFSGQDIDIRGVLTGT